MDAFLAKLAAGDDLAVNTRDVILVQVGNRVRVCEFGQCWRHTWLDAPVNEAITLQIAKAVAK